MYRFAPSAGDSYIGRRSGISPGALTRPCWSPSYGAVERRQGEGVLSSQSFRRFDQYLQDIQKLPLIKDPAEERRLARRVQRGDEKAAERLVTANLRFVISYVKKYQGHGLDLSELVAIGNEGSSKR